MLEVSQKRVENLVSEPEGRDHFGILYIDEGIILKLIIKAQDMRIYFGLGKAHWRSLNVPNFG
jgi:hypothetical protein